MGRKGLSMQVRVETMCILTALNVMGEEFIRATILFVFERVKCTANLPFKSIDTRNRFAEVTNIWDQNLTHAVWG